MIKSLKNKILQTWKLAQYDASTNPGGDKIINLIGAYGPNGWLNDPTAGFKAISWDHAANGVMEMEQADILIDVTTAGTLYGFRIISEDAEATYPMATDAGIDIKVDVKTVSVGDVIRVTDCTLGIDD